MEKKELSQIYFSFAPHNELDIIRMTTAADFAWNVEEYIPARSLWCTLLKHYGFNGAVLLLDIDEEYMKLSRLLFEFSESGENSRQLKKANSKLLEIKELISEFNTYISDEEIIQSMDELIKNAENRINEQKKKIDEGVE